MQSHKNLVECFANYINNCSNHSSVAFTEVMLRPETRYNGFVIADVLELSVSTCKPWVSIYEAKVTLSDLKIALNRGIPYDLRYKYSDFCQRLYLLFPLGFTIPIKDIPKEVGIVLWDNNQQRKIIVRCAKNRPNKSVPYPVICQLLLKITRNQIPGINIRFDVK